MSAKFIFFILFSFAVSPALAQNLYLNDLISNEKRTEQHRLEKMVLQTLQLPVQDSTINRFQSAFWAMEYLQFKPLTAKPKIQYFLKNFLQYNNNFKNALLELVYSNYFKDFEKEILVLVKDTGLTSKQFAVSSEYLLRIHKKFSPLVDALREARMKNLKEEADMILFAMGKRYKTYTTTAKKQLCNSIFNNSFLPNKTLLLSLQNKNRNYPGIVVLRKANGEILRLMDTVFYVTQLARSITNLPYYISNGNTPQGLYRIDGLGVSKNSFIGPTENFQLCMPFECRVNNFFDAPVSDTVWTNNLFASLIPEKFQMPDYSFLYESAIAGKAGRYEIIAHGTTVNTDYYATQSYKGFTPTMGCLQAKEIWNYQNGERLYSDQQLLIDAFKTTGAKNGYLIVIDIKSNAAPVTINDFKDLLK